MYRAVDVLQSRRLLDPMWQTTITRCHLPLWEDKKATRQPSKSESQPVVSDRIMAACDWSRYDWSRFAYCGSEEKFIYWLNLAQVRMSHGHYNAKQIEKYWEWVFDTLQSPTKFDFFVHRLWWKVWEAAERETAAHRKQGTFAGPNSLGLLRLKTSAAIKALNEKIRVDGWDTLYCWEPEFALGA